MEEAVEICKLRLFLKLVAQIERVQDIEPLPDIDFNIRVGNTLVGFSSLEEVRAAAERESTGQSRLVFGEIEAHIKRIEEDAEISGRAFREFQDMQTERGISPKKFSATKGDLRSRLKKLTGELDRFLEKEYRSRKAELFDKTNFSRKKKSGDSLEEWRKSHRPFHWLAEFYGILNMGGFDVIIGNPPYVEYSKTKGDYTILGYRTEECGNLFAYVWERSIVLANSFGRIGLIIPVASVCTDGYTALRQLWLSSGDLFVANFNDRPGKLFDGLEHIRLAIVLLGKYKGTDFRTQITRYNKWHTEARDHLFHSIRYVDATGLARSGSIPKIGSALEASVLAKIEASKKELRDFIVPTGGFRIYYTRKLSGFVQILDFVPSIMDGRGKKREPSEMKVVSVINKKERDAFLCVLNSSLFFWYITILSDCRNLNMREVLEVPFDYSALNQREIDKIVPLALKLMADFKKNSKVIAMNYKAWGTMNIQCIYPKYSKSIIDEIDDVLARHYGFTDEELDFIINYDIKYRMGQEAEASNEA